MLILSRTRAFAKYLKRVGNSTFHINSSYIGLEWIARGKGKPDDLEINWTNPKDPKSSVDQSRQLLHAALLGYVFDSIDSYLQLLANVDWLKLSDEQRNILRKSVTRPGGKQYAVWERFDTLGLDLGKKGNINLAMVRVLSAWRNKGAHEGLEAEGEVRLDDDVKNRLLAAEICLANQYGGLSASEMFKQMSGHSSPRRKEIVGPVSASVNLTRLVDGKLVANSIERECDLEAVAFSEIARALSGKDQKLQSAVRRLWGTNEAARERRFTAILQEAGFKKVDATDRVGLPNDFAIGLAKKNLEVAMPLLDVHPTSHVP